ncbi:hemolysin III [Nematocida sp. AWRm77]|nr:hemolysin III [Nematocida sp. AWRm77]
METTTLDTKRSLVDTSKEAGESVSEESGSCYAGHREKKPYWRGKIHRIAFYATIGIYILLMYFSTLNKVYLSVYFASQLILYGVSSTYHMTEWSSREAEKLFQKLDHSSIFLLISGTQTCVLMSIYELYAQSTISMFWSVFFTYILAGIGIGKVFLLTTLPRYANVIYYVFHGASVAIFVPLECFIKNYGLCILCIVGGVLYILGGTVYSTRKPNPWPKIFGYHEVFHILTVLGNLCFLLTIIWAEYKKTL